MVKSHSSNSSHRESLPANTASPHCCSENPTQVSRDFEEVCVNILSQHFIQSFSPGEITPERVLEIGKVLCKK
ncbi:MAG: relaxase/mobilization nuclease domain-containing protein [Oscillospiraceae bacterium]|nr:relaxase/mobilization nuclease domain-containing protein [Oscillospiraceae bacterium]MDE6777767.1 relaxase/mobilization nuclease domain-containing protein [Oscillospiraceae bacterium]